LFHSIAMVCAAIAAVAVSVLAGRWSSAVAMAQPQNPPQWLTIASWNIERLPKDDDAQSALALAEHLELAGVDLLALQEISDTDSGAPRRNRRLDEVFAIVNQKPGQTWEYRLFPKKDPTDDKQLVGVAWNTAVLSIVGDPLRIGVADDSSDEFNTWDRDPHAVKFTAGAGRTDFVVIPVHMKSNVDGVQFGREQRQVEANALIARLNHVRTTLQDRDVIIIGDTNCLDAAEPALTAYIGAGFRDLNAGDRPTFVTGGPFDRVLVARDQSEFRFSKQYVLAAADAEAHDRFLSDHFMILTPVRLAADDDP
jgi:endonuclease/exonuclease/phosphatase family metal-dependent hydrolase